MKCQICSGELKPNGKTYQCQFDGTENALNCFTCDLEHRDWWTKCELDGVEYTIMWQPKQKNIWLWSYIKDGIQFKIDKILDIKEDFTKENGLKKIQKYLMLK